MRLLLDVMLGKLATYLRMCGHDAAYALDRGIEDDDALRGLARAEGRLLVSRDADLARRSEASILLSGTTIEDQLRELRAAGVELSLDRPERCGRCNGRVGRVPDGEPTPGYAPAADEESVWRCRNCGQHFWRGSHWDDVRERLRSL